MFRAPSFSRVVRGPEWRLGRALNGEGQRLLGGRAARPKRLVAVLHRLRRRPPRGRGVPGLDAWPGARASCTPMFANRETEVQR